jgi:hypothetical protein
MSYLTSARSALRQIQRQTCIQKNHHPRQTISRNVTALSLAAKKRKGKKITMVTAYDYPSAVHVQRAGVDMVLIGDSVAMVELGHDNTQPMSVDHMVHHCNAVHRGVLASMSRSMDEKPKKPLLIGDMVSGLPRKNICTISLLREEKIGWQNNQPLNQIISFSFLCTAIWIV